MQLSVMRSHACGSSVGHAAPDERWRGATALPTPLPLCDQRNDSSHFRDPADHLDLLVLGVESHMLDQFFSVEGSYMRTVVSAELSNGFMWKNHNFFMISELRVSMKEITASGRRCPTANCPGAMCQWKAQRVSMLPTLLLNPKLVVIEWATL